MLLTTATASAQAPPPEVLTPVAAEPPLEESGPEVVWEYDAYYTSVGLHVPLTSNSIPTSRGKTEAEIYGELLVNSFRPQLMLLELSVNPLPLVGVLIRDQYDDFYFNTGKCDRSTGRCEANLIESLTAGFPEPGAVSLFFGSAMNFVKPGEKRKGTNKGYIGYLISGGTQHIKDNVLYEDDWYELEWKLKGSRDFKSEQLSWSFRVGGKFHSRDEIADTVYFGLRRSHLDFSGPFLSFFANSELRMRLDFTASHGNFAFGEITAGKKYPIQDWKVALTLDAGFIVENRDRYLGALRDPDDEIIFVIRPNIQF